MQEYLQKQIRSQGLGAEPIDKTAITKRFGSMIYMDKINSTISGETTKIQSDAANTASQLAAQTLSDTNDPIKARQALEKSLRDAGGKESFINHTTQAWFDANTNKFKDIETLKTNERNARTTEVFDALTGGMGEDQAVEAMVADLPKAEQQAERNRLYGAIDKQGELRQNQVATRDYYVGKRKIAGQNKIDQAKNNLATLEGQQASVRETSIPDSAYELSKTYAAKLGGSVAKAIGGDVTNFIEAWAGKYSDKGRIMDLYRSQTDNHSSDDISAALALAYSEVDTDGFLGNNINGDQHQYIEGRVNSLLQAKTAEKAFNSRTSQQRQNISQIESDVANDLNDFTFKLNQAGRNTRLKVKGASNIEQAANNTEAFLSKIGAGPIGVEKKGGNAAKTETPPAIAAVLAKQKQNQEKAGTANAIKNTGVEPYNKNWSKEEKQDWTSRYRAASKDRAKNKLTNARKATEVQKDTAEADNIRDNIADLNQKMQNATGVRRAALKRTIERQYKRREKLLKQIKASQ
jgi:hypothetical protein